MPLSYCIDPKCSSFDNDTKHSHFGFKLKFQLEWSKQTKIHGHLEQVQMRGSLHQNMSIISNANTIKLV